MVEGLSLWRDLRDPVPPDIKGENFHANYCSKLEKNMLLHEIFQFAGVMIDLFKRKGKASFCIQAGVVMAHDNDDDGSG